MTSTFPNGRLRIVAIATPITAIVPTEFPTIATNRAGSKPRWSWASGMLVPDMSPWIGAAIATPIARPT